MAEEHQVENRNFIEKGDKITEEEEPFYYF
jgi:hypothetical protein